MALDTAPVVDIVAAKGKYFERGYDVTTTFDPTGYNFKMQVREKEDENSKLLLSFTLAGNNIVITPVTGGFTMVIKKNADLMNLKVGIYYYDIIVYTSAQDEEQLMRGKFTITTKVSEQA